MSEEQNNDQKKSVNDLQNDNGLETMINFKEKCKCNKTLIRFYFIQICSCRINLFAAIFVKIITN